MRCPLPVVDDHVVDNRCGECGEFESDCVCRAHADPDGPNNYLLLVLLAFAVVFIAGTVAVASWRAGGGA